MGAITFESVGVGENPEEVFDELVETAQYEHGQMYTGTIAEKSDFKMVNVPKHHNRAKHINKVLDPNSKYYDSDINDKWGPAGCILLEKNVSHRTEKIPRKIKRAKYVNKSNGGRKKWKQVYSLYPVGNKTPVDTKDKKADAVSKARKIAKKEGRKIIIKVEKKLVNKDPIEGVVKPLKREPKEKKVYLNKYVFFGWASC